MDWIWITLGIAVVIEGVGLARTWQLIWPSWKRAAKPVFYLGMTALLTHGLGPWALVFVVLHPLLGWLAHYGFCRKHDMNPWKVEDPQRYVALQRQVVASLAQRRT
ncbi:MAG: hypothetical protein AAF799_40360 [Myxococcota bacterium]